MLPAEVYNLIPTRGNHSNEHNMPFNSRYAEYSTGHMGCIVHWVVKVRLLLNFASVVKHYRQLVLKQSPSNEL
jgi:hydroxyacyl-ACP dehydratase HTD2-like protein with hotdog domain